MPSAAKSTRVCVFGDSHIGCIKNALAEALFTPPKGWDIEFWGAEGSIFREFSYRDGKIIPGEAALPALNIVNGKGREALDPKDFDVILFMGARIRSANLFEPDLTRQNQADSFLSEAVFFQNCADWLRRQRFYVAARDFAQTTPCKIVVAPTSFLAEGNTLPRAADRDDCFVPNAQGVDRLWSCLEKTAAQDGIVLLRQPPETCAEGSSTKLEYCTTTAKGVLDPIHRTAAYGALILEQTATRVH